MLLQNLEQTVGTLQKIRFRLTQEIAQTRIELLQLRPTEHAMERTFDEVVERRLPSDTFL